MTAPIAPKRFQRQVAESYGLLGFQVSTDPPLPGERTDIIARKEVKGAPRIVLAIECDSSAHPLGRDAVAAFAVRLGNCIAVSEANGGVLISAAGFAEDAHLGLPMGSSLSLISWDQLNGQVLDVRQPLQELVDRYRSSEIFHNYLPLDIDLISWTTGKVEPRSARLADVITDWTSFDEGIGIGALLVLADFGAGKTTLLRRLEYERAVAHLNQADPRLPLFVPLREYRETGDLETLLRASFREAYLQDLPAYTLWQRIQSGYFFVLLDGFDEMSDRSDSSRRLELFNELMPVLRSPSPVVLSSRPSYLVGRDELESLLRRLHEAEAPLSSPIYNTTPPGIARAARMRRGLVNAHRESRPSPKEYEPLNPREVQVVSLLPLAPSRLEEFVSRHAAELEAVGVSVAELIAFINRVYDLGDLASRPILLNLIISSVTAGALDVSDGDRGFGASGLYEVYTQAKLDLDIAKGEVRRHGLPSGLRRALAEGFAIQMYRDGTLELDFAEGLTRLVEEDTALARRLEETGLSKEQIATDFATCSFVTLERGRARFVHKSFRGFFLARAIKEALPGFHPLLSEPLEHEVLYFLGGFNPTEPAVGATLLSELARAESSARVLRRNLLVAYLFTNPEHADLTFAESEIAQAEFGPLHFSNVRFEDLTWRQTQLPELTFEGAGLERMSFDANTVDRFRCTDLELDLDIKTSEIESWEGGGLSGRIDLRHSHFGTLSLADSALALASDDATVQRLTLAETLLFAEGKNGTLSVSEADLLGSRLKLDKRTKFARLKASSSAVELHGGRRAIGSWELEKSLLVLASAERDRPSKATIDPEIVADAESVIFAAGVLRAESLRSGAGVFGSLGGNPDEHLLHSQLPSWGVLEAENLLERSNLTDSPGGYRLGSLLLLSRDRYEQLLDPDGGTQSALGELRALALEVPGSSTPVRAGGLTELLVRLRVEYEELFSTALPRFEAAL